MSETPEFLSLRAAVEKTLRMGGTDLLVEPKRFASYVLDIADHTKPEVRLVARQVDVELLEPIVQVAKNPSEIAFRTSRARVESILVDERFVNNELSRLVADALVGGMIDVIMPSATLYDAAPKAPAAQPAANPVVQPSVNPVTKPSARPASPGSDAGVCPRCGAKLKASGAFCPMCGRMARSVSIATHTGSKSSPSASTPASNRSVARPQNPYQVVAIAAGSYHTLALRANGTVISCGYNYSGQRDVQDWHDVTQIAAGDRFSVGLTKTGDLLLAGFTNGFKTWNGIRSIAVGDECVAAIRNNGSVLAQNHKGVVFPESQKWYGIKKLGVGRKCLIGVTGTGSVLIAGSLPGWCLGVKKWHDIVDIAVGSNVAVGLTKDGRVLRCGTVLYTSNGQSQEFENQWQSIVSIAAGSNHAVGLRSDGTVVTAGNNSFGQLYMSHWGVVVAIAAGEKHTVGLRANGKVVAAGDNTYNQCNVERW